MNISLSTANIYKIKQGPLTTQLDQWNRNVTEVAVEKLAEQVTCDQASLIRSISEQRQVSGFAATPQNLFFFKRNPFPQTPLEIFPLVKIGAGTACEVYKIQDGTSNTVIKKPNLTGSRAKALKLQKYNPETVCEEELKNEYEILFKLHHTSFVPSILPQCPEMIRDALGHPIALKLQNLYDLLTLTDESLEAIRPHLEGNFTSLIQGLSYLHSQHVYHLDISDGNILCANDFSFKLCDWAGAKYAPHINFEKENNSFSSLLVYTPSYLTMTIQDGINKSREMRDLQKLESWLAKKDKFALGRLFYLYIANYPNLATDKVDPHFRETKYGIVINIELDRGAFLEHAIQRQFSKKIAAFTYALLNPEGTKTKLSEFSASS